MDNPTAFHAEEYNEKIKKTIPFLDIIYDQILDIVLTLCNRGEKSWLDIGCGTGNFINLASERISGGYYILCDIDEKMLEIAKSQLGEKHNIKYIKGDIRNIEFGCKTTITTAIQVLHYFKHEDRMQILRKIYDGLEEGGIFIYVDNTAPATINGTELALLRWKKYQIKNGETEIQAQNHIRRYGSEYYPQTIKQQIEDLKTVGFKESELFWRSYIQAGFYALK